ncbi:MAG TPA: hypothetical protein VN493_19525 [Thermoanaerobaculia bacterium]|nr:hypothetical protein [Thermoanaerobaculia bacterium]
MSTTFLAWDGALLDGAWQGVEYLSADFTVPGFAAVVTAHLARSAAGLSAEDVTVAGGESLTDLPYEVQIQDGDDFFVVRFPVRGDHAPYAVGLANGGDDPLHPFFRAAEFSFYIDCPAGDCRDHGELPLAAPGPAPSVDTLHKDFRGFVQTLAEWVRVHNPHWADLADASLERVLLDLLAHQADHLSYYQDRVANEAFLDTASQRYSLRQHAALLGYRPFDGRAARTTLAFHIQNPGFVPRGLVVRLQPTTDEAELAFTTAERVRVEPENNWDQLAVAAWPGADTARIPQGARELLLWGQQSRLAAGRRLVLAQGPFWQLVTLTAAEAVAEPGWTASPADPPHNNPSLLTRLAWAEPLAADLFPWRPGEPPLVLSANLVDAVHGSPRRAWVAPAPAAVAPGDVVVRLDRRNSIVVLRRLANAEVPQLRALQVPEGPVLFDRIGDEDLPALSVRVDEVEWERVETLQSSRSFDTHYTADADEDGRIWLRFGDGTHGSAVPVDPATGEPAVPIELRYRVGDPLAGNCARETLTRIVPPAAGTTESDELAELGLVATSNVVPGRGGERPESRDALRQAIPASLRHGRQQRAVALADYAAAAREADPRVARAAARALGGPFNTVIVLVDPEGQDQLDEDLRETVFAHLDRVRMAGREHFVFGADYVPLEIELVLCVCPGFLAHEVRDRVLRELRPGTRERPGWFHPDRLTFGDDVELGDLLAFVQAITGVRSVKATLFRRLRLATDPPVLDRIELGLTEVARLDADENFPEHGVLRVRTAGLDAIDPAIYQLDGPVDAEALP